MAYAGEQIENPAMGGRIVFRKTAADTGGDLVEFDFYLDPGGTVGIEHLHPGQDESFEVLAGTVAGRVGGEPRVARTGETASVPRGTRHTWWNEGPDEAHLLVRFRPGLHADVFFENVFGLACEGKADRHGLPRFVQRAVMQRDFDAEMRPARVPVPVLRLMAATITPVAKRLGYRPRYARFELDGP